MGIGLKADAKGKIQNSEALEFGNGFFDWDDEKLRKQTSQILLLFFFVSVEKRLEKSGVLGIRI